MPFPKNKKRLFRLLFPILILILILLGVFLFQPPYSAKGYNRRGAVPMETVISVNVNTADEEILTLLPGIGKAKAKAIVEYREQCGAFQNLEQLSEIKGISEKMVLSWGTLVVLE